MATKNCNREQDGDSAQGSGQLTAAPVPFDTYEWAFQDVAPEQRPACLWRELVRQAFFDKQQPCPWPSWLGRTKAQQERDSLAWKLSPGSSVQDAMVVMPPELVGLGKVVFPYDRILQDVPHREWEAVELRIDWLATDEELKRDFAEWLARRRNREGTLAWKFKGSKGKRGSRGLVDDRLVDLAIYRAKKAGFDTTKALNEKLGPLLEKVETSRKVNAQRVYDACQRVPNWIRATGF